MALKGQGMKRGGESRGPPAKRGRGPPAPGRFAFKVLCPEILVASVMGSGGRVVTQMQDQSGCHCKFSRRGEFFPNSSLRVLVVTGSSPEGVMTCLELVLDKVVQCAEEERQDLEAAGTFGEEDGEFIDASGDYRLCLALPQIAASGSSDIQDETGIRLFVEEEEIDNHRLVVVAGTREQLTAAVERFNSLVQSSVEEQWFDAWALQRAFSDAPTASRGSNARGPRLQKDTHSGCTIFVGGLSQSTEPSGLRNYFQKFGEVKEADVRMDYGTGRSKGFGFVTFSDASAVDACFANLKDHILDGKWVDVQHYSGHGGEATAAGPPATSERKDNRPMDKGRQASAREGRSFGGGKVETPQHDSRGDRYPVRADRRGGSSSEKSSREVSSRNAASDIRWFSGLAEKVPTEYLELDYSITCHLPGAHVGALIGRGGEVVSEVERKTGAKVQISRKERGSDHRTLSIVGPILSVYGAHLLLMQAYNDHVNQSQESSQVDAAAEFQKIEELQKQIESLKQQMARR